MKFEKENHQPGMMHPVKSMFSKARRDFGRKSGTAFCYPAHHSGERA
jgi:hypothetical protein